ncbi:hypothetical protein [Streptomyces sp. A1547]|uniref:hypothetical protein n=1 Tax=Streptomyces sp. A1547 TaxID=2563105 RepID=UPI00109E99E8|nr:hypothetical protein [Streptomyces sp. A1547]THA31561.1 hypothetical protein E6W17_35605 [Streptomyces sp. A1547]
MVPEISRGLAAVALLAALAMTATACGEPEPDVPTPATPTANTEPSPTAKADEDLGKLFPGTDGGSGGGATVAVPTTQLDEPAGGTMELANDQQVPLTVQPLKASTDSGEISIVEDGCTGVTLQPQETCSVRVSHVAHESGAWTGTVIAPTAEGPVFSVTLTGEAVGAAPDSTTEPPAPTPDETPETPDETETPTPEPGLT